MFFARLFFLLLVLAYCATNRAVALTEKDVETFSKLPQSKACRRIDFDNVQIVPGFVKDTWFAVVSGTKPWVTMKVNLVPLVYIRQPEYWGIEVIGCQTGIGLPQQAPYTNTISAHNMGTKGIEIIGATRAKIFDIPPR